MDPSIRNSIRFAPIRASTLFCAAPAFRRSREQNFFNMSAPQKIEENLSLDLPGKAGNHPVIVLDGKFRTLADISGVILREPVTRVTAVHK
jgi:hypothetical protein